MQSETGLQLLARLGSRPSIAGVLSPIFNDGPSPKDVIELFGTEGTGKSEILMNLVAGIILPKTWKSINLNGKDASVIFIDNDYKFSIIRLVTLMENRIHATLKNGHQTEGNLTNDVEMLIQKCLSKLSLIRCTSSSELLVTLYSLEQTLLSNPNLSVIMIDSVSAFYWIDKCNGGESLVAQERNLTLISEVLSKFINSFSLIVIATKCALMKKRIREDCNMEKSASNLDKLKNDHQEFLCKAWGQLVTHRFHVEKQLTMNHFKCQCIHFGASKNDRTAIQYQITDNGIQAL